MHQQGRVERFVAGEGAPHQLAARGHNPPLLGALTQSVTHTV